jgi:membrane associated rhomboid family serine protease
VFLPIGDTPNPRDFNPWVNWLLIAANVAIYLLITLPLSYQPVDPNDPLLQQYLHLIAPSLPSLTSLDEVISHISAADLFVFQHGYKPGNPHVVDLMMSMFLHGGLLHVAGNMLFLWIFGDNVEQRLGRIGYLVTYLVTGALATLSFSLLAGHSMIPLVGASGAISGVTGVYFLLFGRNKIKVLILLFPIYFNVVLIPARWLLGFVVVVENVLPFILTQQSNVAYGAHLGGFIGGLGIAFAVERLSWHWPGASRRLSLDQSSEQHALTGDTGTTAVMRLQEALSRNDRPLALSLIPSLNRQDIAALSSDECVVVAGWLHEAGDLATTSNLLRHFLSVHQHSRDLARVYLALGLIRLEQGQKTTAYQYLLSVFDYAPDFQTAAQARQALAQIDTFRRG